MLPAAEKFSKVWTIPFSLALPLRSAWALGRMSGLVQVGDGHRQALYPSSLTVD